MFTVEIPQKPSLGRVAVSAYPYCQQKPPPFSNEKRGLSCPSHKLGTLPEIPPGTSCRARALPLPCAPPSGTRQSLPPSRGKVARPKAVTDEGARQVIASYRKKCLPAPPPHPPPSGAPSPRRVEGLPCGGRGILRSLLKSLHHRRGNCLPKPGRHGIIRETIEKEVSSYEFVQNLA